MKRLPLRVYLLALILAIAVPLLAGALALAAHSASQHRAMVEAGVANLAEALALALENHVSATEAALTVLAGSPSLAEGDLGRFYQLAQHARESQKWYSVWLGDAAGRQLFSAVRPFGEALPSLREREYFIRATRTGQPAVSGLVTGRLTAGHSIVVAVPVKDAQSRVRYVLCAGFRPEALSEMLSQLIGRQSSAYPDSVAAIMDRDANIIARTRDPAKWVGQRAQQAYVALVQGRDKGVGRSRSAEGNDVYAGFARIEPAGWVLGVSVPTTMVDGPLRRVLVTGSIAALAVLAVAAGAVALFARGIVSPIQAAAVSAEALARGEPPGLPPTRIAEVARLHDALQRASRLLGDEHRARQQVQGERLALLEEAERARADAESANRAKDVFLAMLGHELRNPLAAITNAVRLLANPRADEKTALVARQIIARQAEHLSRMTDDLLDVGRAISGKIALHRELIDLAKVTTDALAGMRLRTARHHVQPSLAPAWVLADPTRLEQIVANLIGNAVKYSPEGRTIRVEVGPQDGEAVLRVADEGIGMAPELVTRAFELFVQGDRGIEGGRGGLGLGLTMVRHLVELHGGSVEAASAGRGRGSEFTVRLPLEQAPRTAGAPDGAATEASPAARDVLVVEDNDDTRESLTRLLELQGHRVRAAADGVQGLREALANPPHVALVDIGLPGLDGYEVARKVRASLHAAKPYLVAVTGYGTPEDKERALQAGFNAHMTKPLDEGALNALLAAVR